MMTMMPVAVAMVMVMGGHVVAALDKSVYMDASRSVEERVAACVVHIDAPLSVCLYVCMSVCLSVCLSACLPVLSCLTHSAHARTE